MHENRIFLSQKVFALKKILAYEILTLRTDAPFDTKQNSHNTIITTIKHATGTQYSRVLKITLSEIHSDVKSCKVIR